jgi:hypothetical protein
MEELRVVRVPLPVSLIRRMDALLLERKGGYESRAEFIKEAVEAMVTEVQFGPPSDEEPNSEGRSVEPAAHSLSKPAAEAIPESMDQPAPFELSLVPTLDFTELRAPSAEVETLDEGEANPTDDSLWGMHNRDYPSIWAAFKLWEQAKPMRFDHYRKLLLDEAWAFSDRLAPLERQMKLKLSALFPKNKDKPEASADSFFAFAVGSYSETLDGLRAGGPLFQWRICELRRSPGTGTEVGLTSIGLRLLENLEGLSLRLPHSEHATRVFLSHLQEHSPLDWWGFEQVMQGVREPATRSDLVSLVGGQRPQWKENVVATNVSGYVARAREWGLVADKQIEGRYALTPFGRTILEEKGN